MPYQGASPLGSILSPAKDSFSGDGSTTAFTMTVTVNDGNAIEVFVDNVRQEPSVAYTVSARTLTFTGAPPSGTNNIYVIYKNSSNLANGLIPSSGRDSDNVTNFTSTGTITAAVLTTSSTITSSGLVTANADMLIGGATPTLTIGDAGAEDTKIIFDGNAQDFHIGLDDSADDLVIGKGSALGTTPAITIDENLIISQKGSLVQPIVTLVATDAITIAEHAGRILLMGEVGGNAAATFTLPAATGSGAEFRFIVSVVNTSNYIIQVADATDTIDGSVILHQDSANTVATFNTAADSDTITLNGTTKGGVSIGDEITLLDIATNQYMVKGVLTASGTEATPFSAAVS